ncbi:MAG TPA: hypothetical protein VF631_11500 [Allosphingosinicella sp.]|jgi:hypothetical protein|uniref:hypothetical protein n=1 Tax=Allosphingosinicella sp. TaxID=2823234 RepID=UPI002F297685
MSRIAVLLLLSASPALAEPAPVTAEEALLTYREAFKPIAEIDCPAGEGEEIVVCARRQRSERLQAAERAELGARVAGEGGSGSGALNADGCLRLCHRPVTIDIFAMPAFIGKVIERLKDD